MCVFKGSGHVFVLCLGRGSELRMLGVLEGLVSWCRILGVVRVIPYLVVWCGGCGSCLLLHS